MLIDYDFKLDNLDKGIFSILSLIADVHEGPAQPERLDKGIYRIGHFGSSDWLPEFEPYPVLDFEASKPWEEISSYGVCDSYEQILEKCPGIVTSSRQFLITITPIVKALQPPSGGWRWHKWGPYIGKHTPTTEYLYDEPEINMVLVYHVYEEL